MMIIDNVFVILAIEALLAVFLFNNYFNVLTDQKGKIYEQWNNKYTINDKTKVDSNGNGMFFSNIFKKHSHENGQNVHELNDVFSNFMKETGIYFDTFLIIFAVVSMIYLLVRLLTRAIKVVFKQKSSHILPPGKFDGNQNAWDWIENFDLYLEEDNIVTNNDRCAAMLSRIDGGIKKMLLNYDRSVKSNYSNLKNAFLKIYGKKKKTVHEHQADFLMTSQNDMNLYYYHAELCRLAKKAFPDLTEKQRNQQIHDKFINGINSDMLRSSILASYKNEGLMTNFYGGRSLLDRAVELEEIYDRKQVEINFVQGSGFNRNKNETQCYNCLEKGHYKSECKNPKVQKQQQPNQSTHTVKSNLKTDTPKVTFKTDADIKHGSHINKSYCNRIEYTNAITGHCVLDGLQTRFLMDTGANKTIIDARLLNEVQRNEIRPAEFRVILADGSKVPVLGLRKSKVQLGKHIVDLDVLVTENLHEGCLFGIDFLSRCPSTKELIQQLMCVAKEDGGNPIYEIQTCLMPSQEDDCDINNNQQE